MDVKKNMKFTIPGLGSETIPLLAAVVVLGVLPVTAIPQQWVIYIFLFLVYWAMANMWNLHAGYSGLITLCFPAFIGLGGYTMIIGTWVGVPIALGVIFGAIVAALFALVISSAVFRMKGIYFAIGTLVVPEALKYVFLLWRPVGGALAGGGAGYVLKGAAEFSTHEVYWMALALGLASMVAMRFILNSRLGLGLAAIRDNDLAAASSGIDVFRLKLYSFVIGALVCGMAGAIFYVHQAYIEPLSAFSIKWTMIAMLGVVIGGMRIREGPVVGTIIVVILHFLLARYAGYSLLIQGVILVIIMLAVPDGIVGFLRRKRVFSRLARPASGS